MAADDVNGDGRRGTGLAAEAGEGSRPDVAGDSRPEADGGFRPDVDRGFRPDVDGVLESMCRHVPELIAALPGPPPRRIVLHIGQTYLEIEASPPEPDPGRVPVPAPARATDAATDAATHAAPGPAPAGGASPLDEPADQQVTAPAVGTFYRRPEPAADPFVEVGDRVEAGRQVAIVEAMKLMIPVEAPTAGTVTAVHADDGTPVEFGRPLLSIRPEGR